MIYSPRCPMLPLIRAVCAAAVVLTATQAWAVVDVQDPGTFIVDNANVLSADTRQKLENLLKQLEAKTTTQVKLLTVSSLDGEDIFTFSQRHADRWKLGQQEKDNGALIVFALKDRRVRVHTYYGLEGTLPDAWIGTLSRHIAQEYFKRGDYSTGLDQLVRAVAQRVADEEGVVLNDAPPPRFMPPPPALLPPLPIDMFVCLVFLLALIIPAIIVWYRNRHRTLGTRSSRRYWDWGRVFEPPSGPWGPWSGGGFGSGGFGGGFGGGGGSFGGGGSSGGGGGGASW